MTPLHIYIYIYIYIDIYIDTVVMFMEHSQTLLVSTTQIHKTENNKKHTTYKGRKRMDRLRII